MRYIYPQYVDNLWINIFFHKYSLLLEKVVQANDAPFFGADIGCQSGERGDEAVDNVAKYIDEATLLSIKEVSILHGKGNGILRKLIREYLSKQQCVQSFNDASQETGGAGITRITLK